MKIVVLIVKSDKETIEKKTYAYTHKHEGKTSVIEHKFKASQEGSVNIEE